ncbi:MAG TPA: PfkB family carbohydrate kinase [Candidatus Cloacimonadota bacterium]|nr:PfkB family carbohydrate kinase [Candidatus Cloacimonadota bacterium]HPS37873.1 PfkB family carbohydrate kinase [Candidatus Cloacimonadota bacterium]
MSLVIVGSIGLDSVETPVGCVEDILGGSAVYGSVAASHFADVNIVGVVGEDFPKSAIELLKSRKICLDGMEIMPGKTFRWKGKYLNFNQAETLQTDLNVFADFSPKLPDNCRACHSLLLGNIHPALQLQVLEAVTDYSLVACDTMNYWINLCPDLLSEVIRKVHVVLINEDEIKLYTGEQSIFKGAIALLDMGVKVVIVKRGEYGSVTITADSNYFSPAYPVDQVKDTTGAGDSFAGGFLGFLANGGSLDQEHIRKAVRYGTVMAALNVSDFSVYGMLGRTREEIDNMETNLREWTR